LYSNSFRHITAKASRDAADGRDSSGSRRRRWCLQKEIVASASQSKLPNIIYALNLIRSLFGFRNCRQQKRGTNCGDGNDYQKFNQRERKLIVIRVQPVFHPWLKIISNLSATFPRFE
jgi:hypothetical protein